MSHIEDNVGNEKNQSPKENMRLSGRPPLTTLLILALGPIMSEVGSSLFGVVDGIWVGKTLGKDGLSAAGSVFVLDYIVTGFNNFITIAVNSEVGYLHGKNASDKIPHVLFDIFRIVIFFGFLIPAILLPLTYPIMKLIGISESHQVNGFMYFLPTGSCYLITGLFYFLCAILLANGLSFHFGLAQLVANLLALGAFDPLFLVAFKTKIWGSSFSKIVSYLFVVLFLLFYLMKKKLLFEKNSLKQYNWFGGFQSETKSALKVGLSALITQLAMTLPSVVMQKYLSLSSHAIGCSVEVMGVWSIMARVYHVVEMVMTAMARAFIPAASYAYGSHKAKRFFLLIFHILWIGILWASICSFAFSVFPEQICKIWSDDPSFSKWMKEMIPPSVYTAPLMPVRAAVSAILQSMKYGNRASILNFLGQFVATPTYSSILYWTKKDDPVRIVWTYVFSDSTAFLLAILFAISPLKKVYDMYKNENQANTYFTIN